MELIARIGSTPFRLALAHSLDGERTGKLADMVLLSDDIFSMDPAKIRDVKVLKTIVGGKIVWDTTVVF